MKSVLAIFSLVFLCAITSSAEEGSTPLPENGQAPKVEPVNFEEQLPVAESHAAALVRAAKEKRLVMTIFASSACPHCTAFRQGVLITPEFRAFAKEKLVLVVFDITRYDAMTDFEKDMIQVLKERYQVKGTPHIVVESPTEKRLLETEGYRGASADKVVADLQRLWAGVHESR